jgi:hypothetical protein
MSDRLKITLEKAQTLFRMVKEDSSTILPENMPFGIDERILRYFINHPMPADKDFHKLAAELKVDPSKAEENAYILATIGAMFIAGGRSNAEGVGEKDVDAEELRKGTIVEAEHTVAGDNKVAVFIRKRISLDHFAELGKKSAKDSKYYARLAELEKADRKEAGLEKA